MNIGPHFGSQLHRRSGRQGMLVADPHSEHELDARDTRNRHVLGSPSNLRISGEGVAKILAGVAAVVYATGFLIGFTYTQRLGIGDGLGDLFRARHMLVGTFYWLIWLLVGVPSWAFANIYLRNKKVNASRSEGDKEPLIMTRLGLLITLQLLGLLYLVTLVAPPRFMSRQAGWVGLNFFFSVFALGGVFVLIRGLRQPNTYTKMKWWWRLPTYLANLSWRVQRVPYNPVTTWTPVRAALFVLTLVIDWRCLQAEELWPVIWALLWRAKILIGILTFMAYLPYQYWTRSRRAKHTADKRALGYYYAAQMITLFVFSVIAFAYSVYVFIPSERGGGNYTHSPKVVLRLKNDSTAGIGGSLITRNETGVTITEPLILIEQTSAWLHVSPTPVPRNPGEWMPNIVSVRKDLVASMTFVNED